MCSESARETGDASEDLLEASDQSEMWLITRGVSRKARTVLRRWIWSGSREDVG